MKSLLIALLISGMMIKAEDGPFMEQSPSLEDYLEILVAQNPRIKGLEHQIEATQEQITAAKSLPDPTANVGLFLSEIETRLGPQRHKLSLKQTLPWKGKLALKGDVIQRQSQQIQAQRSLVIRELCADFKQNWASLYYLGKQIEKNEEHIDILRTFERVLTTKYENGRAAYAHLIRVQLEADRLVDRLAELKNRRQPIEAKLHSILGVKAHGASEERIPIPFPSGLTPSFMEIDQIKAVKNPLLNQIGFKTEEHKVNLELEKKRSLPDIQVGLDWVGIGHTDMPNIHGSGRDGLAVNLGLNVPIWSKKYKALQRSEALKIEASEQHQIDARLRLEAELQQACFEFEDAQRKIALYRDQIVPKAEETLSVLLTSFESAQSSYLDVLDAERALLEFSLALDKAKTDLFRAAAEIQRITD